LKNSSVGDGHENQGSIFIARIESLGCGAGLDQLLIEILESPQKEKNALLVSSIKKTLLKKLQLVSIQIFQTTLRSKFLKNIPTPASPPPSASGNSNNKEVIQTTFSNNFPGFQEKNIIKVRKTEIFNLVRKKM